jgi:hypothetical protein
MIVNDEHIIVWKYEQDSTISTDFVITNITSSLDTCGALRDTVAKAFCADMYESKYFDAS